MVTDELGYRTDPPAEDRGIVCASHRAASQQPDLPQLRHQAFCPRGGQAIPNLLRVLVSSRSNYMKDDIRAWSVAISTKLRRALQIPGATNKPRGSTDPASANSLSKITSSTSQK